MASSKLTSSSITSMRPIAALDLCPLRTDIWLYAGLNDTHQVLSTGGLLFLFGFPLEKFRRTCSQSIPVCCDRLALYTKSIGLSISSTWITSLGVEHP